MPRLSAAISNQLIYRRSLPFIAAIPLVLVAVFVGLNIKPPTQAAGTIGYPVTPADTGALICGNPMLGGGPTSAPAGAITVAAGDNENVDFQQNSKTFWFAP